MSFEVTLAARLAAQQVNEQPQVVLVIDGVSTIFGMFEIQKVIKVGDTGLVIDGSWIIGGTSPQENQASYIKMEGTTTQITQTLNQDKGIGGTISSVQVALIDKNQEVSNLISPGMVVDDMLGRKCKLYLGFQSTVFPDDYIVLFRGIVDEIASDAGTVTLTLVHPDRKKLQVIYPKCSPKLSGNINNSVTTLTVDDATNMLARKLGPDGTYDASFSSYLIIEDEIMKYTTIVGTTISGITRGQLGTSAAAHSDGTDMATYYRLQGTAMELALKLMLSGWEVPFATGVEAKGFVFVDADTIIDNCVFFENIDLEEDYGLTVGDYVTSSGASNGANNVTLKQITLIVKQNGGSYAVINGVSFVEEHDTSAVFNFRSRYDTLADGLQMGPDEVDVAEHLRLFRLFLSNFSYDIPLVEDVDAKSFIDDEIYNPSACYSLPRKARASVGYHIGPIPSQDIATLDQSNIVNPKTIKIMRSASKNFYNTVIYQFDYDPIQSKFLSGDLEINATSLTQVPVGNKALVIPSKGMRSTLFGKSRAQSAANRRLNRYAFGAEFFKGVQVLFRAGYTVEIGDIVIFDSTSLFITDTKTGTRDATQKLYEVTNKSLDYKTGQIKLDLVDTNFSTASRYGLIGPASTIKTGLSTTQFIIQSSFASVFGDNEYLKWSRYTQCPVKIRSADWTVVGHSTIKSIAGNQITLNTALAFTPAAGYVMRLDDYTRQTDQVKIRNGFMSDTTFGDGKQQYQMI